MAKPLADTTVEKNKTKQCVLGTKDIYAKIIQKRPLAKTSYITNYMTVKLIVYS